LSSPLLDHDRLLKLRLLVARQGEGDAQAWWNTRGALGRLGNTVYARGFPRTHAFAQARVVFAVARARCKELWSPPRCATLWNLPAAVEDAFEDHWQAWLDASESWAPFFESLVAPPVDFLGALATLLTPDELARARELRRSVDGRAVLLPGMRSIDDETIGQLAAGFFRGEKGSPAIPYARLEDA